MLCGTFKQGFLFRVGKENDQAALARPGATPMIRGGKKMSGYIQVEASDCDVGSMKGWIDLAKSHVATLPPKKPKTKRGRTK